jgi:hypothetical protein
MQPLEEQMIILFMSERKLQAAHGWAKQGLQVAAA